MICRMVMTDAWYNIGPKINTLSIQILDERDNADYFCNVTYERKYFWNVLHVIPVNSHIHENTSKTMPLLW